MFLVESKSTELLFEYNLSSRTSVLSINIIDPSDTNRMTSGDTSTFNPTIGSQIKKEIAHDFVINPLVRAS